LLCVVNVKVYNLGLGLLMLFNIFVKCHPPSTFFNALLMTKCFTEINVLNLYCMITIFSVAFYMRGGLVNDHHFIFFIANDQFF